MFNLLDDPWLRVSAVGDLGSDALKAPVETGLRDLVLHADQFRDLVVDLPTQKPAIFRQLLLPLVVDALGSPKDAETWTLMFRAGAFTEEQRQRLIAYMDSHHHRFGLFDPVDPFAQVAGLRTAKGETKGSALLVATMATGNNVPLFSSRTEGDPPALTPAQAAHWLLHTHCWDTAAIKTGAVGDTRAKSGKTTGNPTGPLGQLGVTLPLGRTLYETLLLNIPYGYTRLSDDLPQWRRRAVDEAAAEDTLSCATPGWQSRAARGLLDLWTWQSRRIRLFPEESTGETRVTRVIVAAGDRLDLSPDLETHTAWAVERPSTRTAKPTRKASPTMRPRRHQPGRAAWRGLGPLLAINAADQEREATATRSGFRTSTVIARLSETCRQLPPAYPLQVELTGITYGNQSAVIEDLYHDAIPLPVTALDPDGIVYGALLEAVEQAENLAAAVNHLSGDLRRAAGAPPIPWDKGQRPGDTLLHALDPVVRRLLTGLRTVGEDFEVSERGLEAWERKAGQITWRVADQLLAAVPARLFTGRKVVKDGKERTYALDIAERTFLNRLDTVLHRRAAARRNG
ncbi:MULTISPECIES: type I-E CRISPR-associated protein Cse1/CasA [Streptomyces]|uniref:Type I-E CRISPR-associated protein Cse1/CasA n=1 Tax=Streptomyces ramulosus TaxID=47762 RepID=A0ABW1FJL6_9ACTN